MKRHRGGENEKDEREEKECSNVQRLAFNDEWHDCFEHPNNFTLILISGESESNGKRRKEGKKEKDEEASSWLGEAWSAKRVGNGAERRASGWSGTASRGRFGHVRERGGRDESEDGNGRGLEEEEKSERKVSTRATGPRIRSC